MKNTQWHLRFFLTPNCNFACIYCNPKKLKEHKRELSTSQAISILESAYIAGIRKIHWTGGEPSIRPDFLKLMEEAKKMGFTEQIITTNGWNLHKILDKAVKNGLNRVNISLDTLKEERFRKLTNMNCFDDVIKSIKKASEKVSGYVKINIVTMEETLNELPDFVNFAKELNNDKLILKLICFNPNNPAQLDEKGAEVYKDNNVSFDKIYQKLETIDELEYMENIEFGDNPNCEYYKLKNSNVTIGIIAEPSWNYKCGGSECKKLRITPFGEVANCIQDELLYIGDMDKEERAEVFRAKMKQKEKDDFSGKYRLHYRPQLGEMRFGKVSEPQKLEKFEAVTRVGGSI